MSRIIKLIINDSDYRRLMSEYDDMVGLISGIYEFLKIQSHESTDAEYIMERIESFPVGYEFSYREIFHDYPEKQTASVAKLVRSLCKTSKIVECLGYDKVNKLRLYRRVKGE